MCQFFYAKTAGALSGLQCNSKFPILPVSESVGPGQYKCVSAGQSGSSGSSQLVAVAEGPVPTEKSGSQKHVGESSPFEHIRHHPGSWHPETEQFTISK